ncbi:Ethanolamine-phosphate cytidylyltransferase [Ancistrocladus abbreviatus]
MAPRLSDHSPGFVSFGKAWRGRPPFRSHNYWPKHESFVEVIQRGWEISIPDTEQYKLITTFNISLVVHGTVAESNDFQKENENPYAVPISMDIFKVLESPLDITTTTIIKRIVSNHEAYQVCCASYHCSCCFAS